MRKLAGVDGWFIGILVVSTAILCFLNFSVPFQYDDSDQIVRNLNIRNLFDIVSIINDPIRPQRFIQNLSFAFNWFISERDPWSYHLLNNLLHMGNVILLNYLLPLLGLKDKKIQLATCFLFFVHPLEVESVTYVMGRVDLLKTASTLGLLILYLKRVNKWTIYFLLILSLLIKETCTLTVFLFLALDVTVLNKSFRDINFKQHALYFSHLFFLIPLYYFLDTNYQYGSSVGFNLFPFFEYVLTNFHFLTHYIYLFFNPSEQSVYHEWTAHPPVLSVLLGILIYVGIGYCLITQFRKRPLICFLLFFFLISFLPNNSILQFINPFAEYRLYQSNIVLSFFCSLAVFYGNKITQIRQLIGGLFLVFLLVFHYLHIQTWKSPITLWGYAYATYPASVHTNIGLGAAYISNGLCYSGLKHQLFACKDVENNPFWDIKCNVGLAQHYGGLAKFDKALTYLEKTKKITRYNPNWLFYHNFLIVLQSLGKEERYREILSEAQMKFPHQFGRYQYQPNGVNKNPKPTYKCLDNETTDEVP